MLFVIMNLNFVKMKNLYLSQPHTQFNLGNCYFRHGKLKKESDPKTAMRLISTAGEHYQKTLHQCLTAATTATPQPSPAAPPVVPPSTTSPAVMLTTGSAPIPLLSRDSGSGSGVHTSTSSPSLGLSLSVSAGGIVGGDGDTQTSFFHALTNLGLVLECLSGMKV